MNIKKKKDSCEVYDFLPTYYCNNNCIICTTTFSWKKYKDKTTEELIEEIKQIPKEVGTIVYSGGEPTIRKDFFMLLNKMKEFHPDKRIEILTNGRLFSIRSNVEKLRKMHVPIINLKIPLHSIEENTHDEITQVNGSFKQTLQAIRYLTEAGFDISINFVLNRLNYQQVPEMSKFVKENIPKISKINFRNMFYIRNALINKDKLSVKITEMVPYLENGFDNLLKGDIKFQIEGIPLCCLGEKYWRYTLNSIRDIMRDYSVCKNCFVIDKCSGIEKTYAHNWDYKEIKPINILEKGKEKKKPIKEVIKIIKYINKEQCTKCLKCVRVCPLDIIDVNLAQIDNNKCIYCNSCVDVCKPGAIQDRVN